MGTELLAEGVLTGTVVSPGVPPGKARLRVSLMASHQTHELDTALAAFERVGTKLGVIQRPRVAGS
jgi:glycine C-acetyltransferase